MERELWKIISANITFLDRKLPVGDYEHSVGRIVRVYLWAVLHDRPIYWACDKHNWSGVRPPEQLPDQSTMSRRIFRGDTQQMLKQLARRLDATPAASLLRFVDGKPLPVSKHSLDRQATFGRGAGGQDRGYKFHAIYGPSNQPVAWSVTPLNVSEHKQAAELIKQGIEPGYLLGDANYDANQLHEIAGQQQVQLLTPRRYASAKGLGHQQVQLLTPRRYASAKGLGHHQHSSYRRDAIARLEGPSDFARSMLKQRRRIETRFAHLTNFGGGLTCLPPWVRSLRRVSLWVQAKIIIRLARDTYLGRLSA